MKNRAPSETHQLACGVASPDTMVPRTAGGSACQRNGTPIRRNSGGEGDTLDGQSDGGHLGARGLAVFLASEEFSWMTGTAIP
jgi:hypothetical protein